MAEFHLRCEVCGKPFVAHNPRKKRCSKGCDEVAKDRRAAEYRALMRKEKEERRRPRHLVDGVSESIRSKVLEAMALGVSYGQLSVVKARKMMKEA